MDASTRSYTFDLPEQPLSCGATLAGVRIGYTVRGTLAPDGSNAVLLQHGYTSGPAILDDATSPVDGGWCGLVGPGRAIDTDRYFVICPAALGSPYGSTHAGSTDPRTGQPYGEQFPLVTAQDIVSGQRALLEHLGIRRLVAVVGASFGGVLALQWGLQEPQAMAGLVVASAAPRMPGTDAARVAADLAAAPGWGRDDEAGRAALTAWLEARRVGTLAAFGADAALAMEFPEPAVRKAEIQRLAAQWAREFDARALLVLMRTMHAFDAGPQLHRIRAPLLYTLCTSDRLVPASLAPGVLAQLAQAGVRAQYVELASDHGHCAANSDHGLWSAQLKTFIDGLAAGTGPRQGDKA